MLTHPKTGAHQAPSLRPLEICDARGSICGPTSRGLCRLHSPPGAMEDSSCAGFERTARVLTLRAHSVGLLKNIEKDKQVKSINTTCLSHLLNPFDPYSMVLSLLPQLDCPAPSCEVWKTFYNLRQAWQGKPPPRPLAPDARALRPVRVSTFSWISTFGKSLSACRAANTRRQNG